MGQWKHSKVENPEWNKKAYSWPVEENGDINEQFDWPMEGYFIPYAPPIRKPKEPKTSQQGMFSKKVNIAHLSRYIPDVTHFCLEKFQKIRMWKKNTEGICQ